MEQASDSQVEGLRGIRSEDKVRGVGYAKELAQRFTRLVNDAGGGD
jgi:hypothetical protein